MLIRKLATIVLLNVAMISCSNSPTMSEEELLSTLVKVNHVGPLNFRRDVWPSLQGKTITYCGSLQEVTKTGAQTALLMNVDKQSGGEILPWSLEGKSASPEVVGSYKPGDSLCMEGTLDGFSEVQEHSYRGYVQIASLAKSVATK